MSGHFARYLAVGGTAFLLHLLVLEGLLGFGFPSATAASAIGFIAACVLNFCLQRVLVFRTARRWTSAAWRYIAITLMMLGVNAILFFVLNARLGAPPAAAQTVATGIVFLLNFVCNRHFTFAAARVS